MQLCRGLCIKRSARQLGCSASCVCEFGDQRHLNAVCNPCRVGFVRWSIQRAFTIQVSIANVFVCIPVLACKRVTGHETGRSIHANVCQPSAAYRKTAACMAGHCLGNLYLIRQRNAGKTYTESICRLIAVICGCPLSKRR